MESKLEGLLSSFNGGKIKDKQPQLEKLAASSDGAKVKKMLDGKIDLNAALENNDTESVSRVVNDVLSTKEGARLLKQLEELFK